MSYQILLHPRAARFLNRLDATVRERMKQSLGELKGSPEEKGEPLRQSPYWRLRVGDYRVIYEINEREMKVVVLFIGHRKDVYDDFSRLLE